MANKKKKIETITTPFGVAKYPRLQKPDTKYKPEGEYSVKLVVDRDEASEALLEKLTKMRDEKRAAVAKDAGKPIHKVKLAEAFPMRPELDDETGEETGKLVITAKLNARVKNDKGEVFELRPNIFDSAGKKLTKIVGGGTVLRLSVEPHAFFNDGLGCGVQLRLRAAQVKTLVEYVPGERGADSYGFDEVEGGYTSEESESAMPESPEADGDNDGDNDAGNDGDF